MKNFVCCSQGGNAMPDREFSISRGKTHTPQRRTLGAVNGVARVNWDTNRQIPPEYPQMQRAVIQDYAFENYSHNEQFLLTIMADMILGVPS